MSAPTCSKCHRPLTDPVSIWMGIGPECRGKRLAKQARKIERTIAFQKGEPVILGEDSKFVRRGDHWVGLNGAHVSQETLQGWLEAYGFIIPNQSSTLGDDCHKFGGAK